MAKYFLPKNTKLTEKIIEELKFKFKLIDLNITDIKRWNSANSPSSGIIINTDKDNNFFCFPYEKEIIDFFKEFPDGKILRIVH